MSHIGSLRSTTDLSTPLWFEIISKLLAPHLNLFSQFMMNQLNNIVGEEVLGFVESWLLA